MSTPLIDPSFVSGEVAPALFGRVDLARLKSSASTARNMFVRFTGGMYSRAGTAFVNYSKQTGRGYPPKLITFQFNVQQGLALEFGNYYMRVIYDGALVTDNSLPITNITNANPAVMTAPATGGSTATPDNSGVYSSYSPGEVITLAGGSYVTPAKVSVTTTKLLGIAEQYGIGSGYAPGDTVTLAGGISSPAAVITIGTTRVNAATIHAAGSGGVTGTWTVTGTTGTGTKFQASVTISGGIIITVNSITNPGSYSVNPTVVTAEPVTGGGLTGAQLSLSMGIDTLSVTTAGVFTANPPGGVMTQASTSGGGSGAQFVSALFGVNVGAVSDPGSYTTFPTNPVSQASSTGSGLGVQFNMTTVATTAFSAGDWIYLSGITGMTEFNGRTVVVGTPSGSDYPLYDVLGNPVDSSAFGAYTGGGVASRIYTLMTPWAEADLEWLKATESADVFSICCVNQDTGTEYPPYDLRRLADNNWTITQVMMEPTVSAPPWCATQATNIASYNPDGTVSTPVSWASYSYKVTAVHPIDGTESVASPIGNAQNQVDIAAQAGTITINWGQVDGVNQYNVYKAQPGYASWGFAQPPLPPVGALFGYIGSAYGTQLLDQNIVADYAQVPPTHSDPFARGQILGAVPINGGGGYSYANVTINTSTGSEGQIAAVVLYGHVVAFVVVAAGRNYAATDTVTVTGDGSGATAQLQVGPQTGTYPGVVAYFQQRRAYANTINNPDTYWMSQPGAYTNFDFRIPTIDSDAITGTPWSQQVNGIQWMLQMPGGLVVLTGLGAWQVGGVGSSALNPQPITPSGQQAQPQAFYGCSSTIQPIVINYDIIYVEALGAIYRDLSYQFFTNIYTGTDLTINSIHLFQGYDMREHAWCRTPWKIIWAVRTDGVMLSLTYLKEENVIAWTRHDTNGFFQSLCSVKEPPVDALYLAVQRNINGQDYYMLERMNDRQWNTVEDTWCVDCGLALAQPAPNTTLHISSQDGIGSLSGVTDLIGGSGYSAGTYAVIADDNGLGAGSGAVPVLTISGGQIVNVAFSPAGASYVSPKISFIDPANTGSGASATVVLNTTATFITDAPAFSIASVGDVIRAAGGIATITDYITTMQVTGTITAPFSAAVQPNSGGLVQDQPAGQWTLTTPVSHVSMPHLAGATVTGLADGNPIPPTYVPLNGTLSLPSPSSSVTVGLAFQAQWQSVYLDAGEPTVQGQRKKVGAASVLLESSRGVKIGANQVDGSTLSPPLLAPTWSNLDNVQDLADPPFGSDVTPLWTGYVRTPIQGGFAKHGQVCLQQDNPLPMNILAVVPEALAGDVPSQGFKERQQQK